MGIMEPHESQSQTDCDRFHELAAQRRTSLWAEFWDFLKHNKKWWLLPILLTLVLLGGLVLVTGSAWAPFIYTLF